MEQISTFGIEILSRLLHSTSAESILKRLKINYVLPGSLYQLVIFLRRLVVISGEIRFLRVFAKLWLTHRRVTFIKKITWPTYLRRTVKSPFLVPA